MLKKMHGEQSDISPVKVRRAINFFAGVVGLQFLTAHPALGGSSGNIYLFATRQACEASWLFNRAECGNAFANADAETQEMAPGFATKSECERRFHLCRSRRLEPGVEGAQATSGVFSPVMLGVEISVEANRRTVTPVLAVVNPAGMFHPRSIARLEKPDERDMSASAPQPLLDAIALFGREALKTHAPSENVTSDGPTSAAAAKSNLPPDPFAQARRRERLRNAPYIE